MDQSLSISYIMLIIKYLIQKKTSDLNKIFFVKLFVINIAP